MRTRVAGDATWKRDVQCLKDNNVVGERNENTESKSFKERESCEEDEVEWVAMALPVEQAEVDECPYERNV